MKTKTKKVAIVGFAPSWQQAPFADKTIDIWCLNEGRNMAGMQVRCDRWFQMHPRWCWEAGQFRDAGYVKWLQTECTVPVVMLQAQPDCPTSVAFPFTEAIAAFGREFMDGHKEGYITSSFSYMIAMALLEGYEEIQVFGVDLSTDEEYGFQRAGSEYLLGIAAGRGIKLILPDQCPILRSGLYGFYEPDDAKLVFTQELLEQRIKELNAQQAQHQANLAAVNGAIQEVNQWLGRVKFDQRQRWTSGAVQAPIGHNVPKFSEMPHLAGIPVGQLEQMMNAQALVPSDGTGQPEMVPQ